MAAVNYAKFTPPRGGGTRFFFSNDDGPGLDAAIAIAETEARDERSGGVTPKVSVYRDCGRGIPHVLCGPRCPSTCALAGQHRPGADERREGRLT